MLDLSDLLIWLLLELWLEKAGAQSNRVSVKLLKLVLVAHHLQIELKLFEEQVYLIRYLYINLYHLD